MSRTIIYHIGHADGDIYVPTKAEAIKLARQIRDDDDDDMVYVTANVVADNLGRRELYCALLNGESWAKDVEDVAP